MRKIPYLFMALFFMNFNLASAASAPFVLVYKGSLNYNLISSCNDKNKISGSAESGKEKEDIYIVISSDDDNYSKIHASMIKYKKCKKPGIFTDLYGRSEIKSNLISFLLSDNYGGKFLIHGKLISKKNNFEEIQRDIPSVLQGNAIADDYKSSFCSGTIKLTLDKKATNQVNLLDDDSGLEGLHYKTMNHISDDLNISYQGCQGK